MFKTIHQSLLACTLLFACWVFAPAGLKAQSLYRSTDRYVDLSTVTWKAPQDALQTMKQKVAAARADLSQQTPGTPAYEAASLKTDYFRMVTDLLGSGSETRAAVTTPLSKRNFRQIAATEDVNARRQLNTYYLELVKDLSL